MSQEQPKTIVCPSCGNINPYTVDVCPKCGLDLGPVRELLAKTGAPEAEEVTTAPIKPKEPAPPMPELPARPEAEKIGQYVDSWRFLIRGMGDRAEEIAARFFKQLAERGIEGLKLSVGKLIIEDESRDYYFAERDLGEGAVATMAVRIAQMGTDLFVEWRHYLSITPSKLGCMGWFLFILAVYFTGGIALLLPILWPSKFREWFYTEPAGLKGFQPQDNTAFQLAVRAALEEAIDLAGISKALIQELPKEKREERRVI
ncbi:MAG TPA: hypothetical protein EYP49_09110 [Anaerolineae bacterium]|nr:hypothetical protein [Anaerolineae bacterium]